MTDPKEIAAKLAQIAAARDALDAQEAGLVATLAAPTPAPVPAPAPSPADHPTPALITDFDSTKATRIGGEGDAFTPAAGGIVFYGAAGGYYAVQVATGVPVTLSNTWAGGDPLPNVKKSGYVLDVRMVGHPTTSPVPAPPPLDPPPPAPGPAQTPPAAPPPSGPVSPTVAQLRAGMTPETLQAFVKTHLGYGPQHIPRDWLTKLAAQDATDGPSGEMTTSEGDPGYRPEIGDFAYASQLMLITCDPLAEAHMFDQADHGKANFPYHLRLRHQTTAGAPQPWRITKGPYTTFLYDGEVVDANNNAVVGDPNSAQGIQWELAHNPNFMYLPTIVAGIRGDEAKFRAYMEELRYIVTCQIFNTPPQACQYDKGIINPHSGQTRAAAWELRDRSNCLDVHEKIEAFGFTITDEDKKWRDWLAQSLFWTGDFMDRVYNPNPASGSLETGNGDYDPYYGIPKDLHKNPHGITSWDGGYDANVITIAPWQEGFFADQILKVAQRKHPTFTAEQQATWDRLAEFKCEYLRLKFGKPNDPKCIDIRFSPAYTMTVGDKTAWKFFDTREQMKGANEGWRPAATGTVLLGQDGSVAGFPAGYCNNLTPGLARAVDMGKPGMRELWDLLFTMDQLQTQGGDLSFAQTPTGTHWKTDEAVIALPPQEQPAPGPRTLTWIDVTKYVAVATESATAGLVATYTPTVAETLYFGKTKFFAVDAQPGVVIKLDFNVLGDPEPGVVKSLWKIKAATDTLPVETPDPPAPTPAAPAPATQSGLPAWVCKPNAFCSIPQTNTPWDVVRALLPPDGQGSSADDPFMDWGDGAKCEERRSLIVRASGHQTMNQQIGFEAQFDAGYGAITWRGFGAPSKAHKEYIDARMADTTDMFKHMFFLGDDGKPDGSIAPHSYGGLTIQGTADGGAPHLLSFGTGGGLLAFSAVRMDVTKPGRDSYDMTPFPKAGLVYQSLGYPQIAVGWPGHGVFYSAPWNRQGSTDAFLPWDGNSQIAVPPIADDGMGCAVLMDEVRSQVVTIIGGWTARWGTPGSSPNERPRLRVTDYSAGIDKPVVRTVYIKNPEPMLSGNALDTCGPEQMGLKLTPEKYGARIVGVNPWGMRPFVLTPPEGDRWGADWTCTEEKPVHDDAVDPAGMKTIQQPINSFFGRSAWWDALDGLAIYSACGQSPAQLWRPSFVTGRT